MHTPSSPPRKPTDDELDVWGMTHRGRVREENQDHFLVCALKKQLQISFTSLPEAPSLGEGTDRLAFLAMVADGVGGGPRGEEASRLTVAGVTRYLAESVEACYRTDTDDEEAFVAALSEAAHRCARVLRERGREDPSARDMATTLSLWIGVWPRAYLLQVGDSRYYMLRQGQLTQVSRDQTVAQELLDRGVISQASAGDPRLSNTLSSAIGGPETRPVVTALGNDWGVVHLLCSDGLTKHVTDERIREVLSAMTSSRQACETLMEEALEAGGTDNITLVVGRAVQSESSGMTGTLPPSGTAG